VSGHIEAADTIAAFRNTYAASSLGLTVVQHPERQRIIEGILGLDRGSTLRLGRQDNTYYEGIDVWASLDAIHGSADFNLYFLGTFFMVGLSAIGDVCSRHDYFDKTPELELLRHLRNGVSHGNRFNLRSGQPRRPAKFKGFEVTPAVNGQTVLFEFISTGDIFDLLDHIEDHLRRTAPAF
jgi:hypothetical protein